MTITTQRIILKEKPPKKIFKNLPSQSIKVKECSIYKQTKPFGYKQQHYASQVTELYLLYVSEKCLFFTKKVDDYYISISYCWKLKDSISKLVKQKKYTEYSNLLQKFELLSINEIISDSSQGFYCIEIEGGIGSPDNFLAIAKYILNNFSILEIQRGPFME
ncbi:hypothetical protein [Candidatus Uabimicrobium sp. HlEnr_7]|uniref:hypothetical protein n=1 Tax=Candidatus Uabimicrobium helgolandensis TaxID=3095367 RepID=UPI00355819D7